MQKTKEQLEKISAANRRLNMIIDSMSGLYGEPVTMEQRRQNMIEGEKIFNNFLERLVKDKER